MKRRKELMQSKTINEQKDKKLRNTRMNKSTILQLYNPRVTRNSGLPWKIPTKEQLKEWNVEMNGSRDGVSFGNLSRKIRNPKRRKGREKNHSLVGLSKIEFQSTITTQKHSGDLWKDTMGCVFGTSFANEKTALARSHSFSHSEIDLRRCCSNGWPFHETDMDWNQKESIFKQYLPVNGEFDPWIVYVLQERDRDRMEHQKIRGLFPV